MKTYHSFLIVLISLFLYGPLSFADNPKYSQKNINKFPHPQASAIDGCIDASCLNIQNKLKICKCLKDKENSEGSFEILEGQNIKLQWPAVAGFQSDTKAFEALECDMEGSGKKQLVIANFNGQSNGIGVTYWTISIVDLHGFNRPLMFDVEDYGEGSILWNEKERRCDVLATRWQEVKDFRLGTGLYFIGKFFRYKPGVLEPIVKDSILARRYLFSFQKERGDTLNKGQEMYGAPLKWLTNPKTERFKLDPTLERFDSSPIEQGKIKEVILNPDGSTLTIGVQLNTEQMVNYVYPWIGGSDSKNIVDAFADCGCRISYPYGYIPSIATQWLVGKEVLIKSRYDATSKENHHLFLLKCCE